MKKFANQVQQESSTKILH